MSLSRRDLLVAAGFGIGGSAIAIRMPEYPLVAGSSLLEASDSFTYRMQRLLLPDAAMAREFPRSTLTENFPAINTVNPESDAYHRSRAIAFADFRLPVSGAVARPMTLSLADLKRFPSRTQITQHNCVDGWSAIAEWTGVQLSRILSHVGALPSARFVMFRTIDGWWDTFDLADAFHPQTLITYGMNGGPLPMRHGAPLRLRVERQLGYKSLKYLTEMVVLDRIDNLPNKKGSFAHDVGYNWHAGI